MQVQRSGTDLIVVIPHEVVDQQGLKEGDEVMLIKTADRASFEEALKAVLRDHAATFEYLKDK